MNLLIQTQVMDKTAAGSWRISDYEFYEMAITEAQAYEIGEAGIGWMREHIESNFDDHKELIIGAEIITDDAEIIKLDTVPHKIEFDYDERCFKEVQS